MTAELLVAASYVRVAVIVALAFVFASSAFVLAGGLLFGPVFKLAIGIEQPQ